MADQILQRHGTQTFATRYLVTLYFVPRPSRPDRGKRHRGSRTEDAKDNGVMIDAEQELSIERAVFRGIIVSRPRRILARIQRMHRNT
jgi:hypothetical protein